MCILYQSVKCEGYRCEHSVKQHMIYWERGLILYIYHDDIFQSKEYGRLLYFFLDFFSVHLIVVSFDLINNNYLIIYQSVINHKIIHSNIYLIEWLSLSLIFLCLALFLTSKIIFYYYIYHYKSYSVEKNIS